MKKRDFVRIYRKILRRPLTITAILLLLISFLSLQTDEGVKLGEFGELGTKRISELEIDLDQPAPILDSVFQSLNLSISDKISAQAIIILDPTTHTTLYAKNANQKLAPASLTKIATFIVVLENMDLEEIATVPENISEKAQGSLMGLVPGEKIKVENLFWGMLVASGNDAAHSLAMNFPGGYNHFVKKMNELASFLRLKNTHFTNPMGFDDQNHFSSAYDLTLLAKYALRYPLFAEIVKTPTKTVVSEPFSSLTTNHEQPTTYQQWHELKNTNELLGKIDGVSGIKTGYTGIAGECMAISLNRNNKNIIIIILGSKNRLQDTQILIDWF